MVNHFTFPFSEMLPFAEAEGVRTLVFTLSFTDGSVRADILQKTM